jgi:hypothetical protein
MDHGPTAICNSSEEGCIITWTQAGHLFVRISYAQIGLSIADIYCYVMMCRCAKIFVVEQHFNSIFKWQGMFCIF